MEEDVEHHGCTSNGPVHHYSSPSIHQLLAERLFCDYLEMKRKYVATKKKEKHRFFFFFFLPEVGFGPLFCLFFFLIDFHEIFHAAGHWVFDLFVRDLGFSPSFCFFGFLHWKLGPPQLLFHRTDGGDGGLLSPRTVLIRF